MPMMATVYILIPIVIIDSLFTVRMNLIILTRFCLFSTSLISKVEFSSLLLLLKNGKSFLTLLLSSKLWAANTLQALSILILSTWPSKTTLKFFQTKPKFGNSNKPKP
jgi:hypothetical protein